MKQILIILTCLTGLYAQSVDSLFTVAETHHPALLAVKAKIEAAKARAKANDSYPAPKISLELSQIPFDSWDIINDANMNTLTISQMFMPGGKVEAMVKAEESQIFVLEQNYQTLARQFKFKIKNHYLKLWEINQKIELLNEENELLTRIERVLTDKLNYISINSSELIMLKLELSTNQNKLLNLKNDYLAESADLAGILAINNNQQKFNFKLSTPDSLNISLTDLKSALKSNPDLTAMDKMAEMVNLEQTAKDKDIIPDFMLSAMLMRMPNGMYVTKNMKSSTSMSSTESGSDYMYGLMFSFDLPFIWWHKDKITYQKKMSEYETESIELSKKNMEHQMLGKLEKMYFKQYSAWQNINFYHKNTIPAYQETINTQTELLSSGKSDMKMILEMNKMLIMQKMNYIMAVGDFYMAVNDLEQMSGKQLFKL